MANFKWQVGKGCSCGSDTHTCEEAFVFYASDVLRVKNPEQPIETRDDIEYVLNTPFDYHEVGINTPYLAQNSLFVFGQNYDKRINDGTFGIASSDATISLPERDENRRRVRYFISYRLNPRSYIIPGGDFESNCVKTIITTSLRDVGHSLLVEVNKSDEYIIGFFGGIYRNSIHQIGQEPRYQFNEFECSTGRSLVCLCVPMPISDASDCGFFARYSVECDISAQDFLEFYPDNLVIDMGWIDGYGSFTPGYADDRLLFDFYELEPNGYNSGYHYKEWDGEFHSDKKYMFGVNGNIGLGNPFDYYADAEDPSSYRNLAARLSIEFPNFKTYVGSDDAAILDVWNINARISRPTFDDAIEISVSDGASLSDEVLKQVSARCVYLTYQGAVPVDMETGLPCEAEITGRFVVRNQFKIDFDTYDSCYNDILCNNIIEEETNSYVLKSLYAADVRYNYNIVGIASNGLRICTAPATVQYVTPPTSPNYYEENGSFIEIDVENGENINFFLSAYDEQGDVKSVTVPMFDEEYVKKAFLNANYFYHNKEGRFVLVISLGWYVDVNGDKHSFPYINIRNDGYPSTYGGGCYTIFKPDGAYVKVNGVLKPIRKIFAHGFTNVVSNSQYGYIDNGPPEISANNLRSHILGIRDMLNYQVNQGTFSSAIKDANPSVSFKITFNVLTNEYERRNGDGWYLVPTPVREEFNS